MGDSIISGLIEKRLCYNDSIDDRYHYLVLLLKKPNNIIIHCGTNNTNRDKVEEIIDSLLKLKTFIMKSLPASRVIFSYPTVRNDNVWKNDTLKVVRNYLNEINVECICNENITVDCLGKSKLHLNGKGIARLAMNYKSFVKHL